jgi:ribosomal protein S18 acetylase RimI-like enzyme
MCKVYGDRGFRQIAQLLYLQAVIGRGLSAPSAPAGCTWHTYLPETHDLFAHAILQSYRDSLDCPAMNGLRTIDDVIAGHKSSGEFDPQCWFILKKNDQPLAVLLLMRVPRSDMAELAYLGLAPDARGRGLGDVMLRQAFWTVRQRMQLPRVTLAVDSRNIPALKLYYRHGMQQMGVKTAMLRDLRDEKPHEQS